MKYIIAAETKEGRRYLSYRNEKITDASNGDLYPRTSVIQKSFVANVAEATAFPLIDARALLRSTYFETRRIVQQKEPWIRTLSIDTYNDVRRDQWVRETQTKKIIDIVVKLLETMTDAERERLATQLEEKWPSIFLPPPYPRT